MFENKYSYTESEKRLITIRIITQTCGCLSYLYSKFLWRNIAIEPITTV
jgi:hypothetical protein